MACVSLGLGQQLSIGRYGVLAAVQLALPASGKRNYSSDVKYLSKIESTTLKRGRGGRSSFSGMVATIFGATGFTGRYIVNKLGKNGTQLILPYRGDQYYTRHLKLAGDLGQVLFMHFDRATNEEAIKKAMKYSQVVINLIGRDYETKNFTFEQAHVDTARVIAKCAKEMGIERLIHVSALNGLDEQEGYLAEGGSKFLTSKGASEAVVRNEFPDAIIFRPSDIWGQEDRFLRYFGSMFRRTDRLMPLPYGGKGIWKQPVAVSDFAQGLANAITSPEAPGQTYEIAGPRRYELCELIDYLNRVMRRDDEWGHRIIDMKYDPLFKMRIRLQEKLPSTPIAHITMDKIEREAVTDTIHGLPNLEDLGVKLTVLEDVVSWELDRYKAYGYYDDKLGEWKEPELPKYIPAT